MTGLGFEMRTIDGIAHQGMADMGQMHPDLMGAPGLELTGQKRRDRLAVAPVEGFLDFPVSDRLAAGITYCHFLPGKRVPVDRRVHGAALAVWGGPHESPGAAPPRARSPAGGALLGQ